MYAIIDLGSNSFHLLIAEYRDARFSVVARCSEKIQLAQGLNRTNSLSKVAMKRGIDCLHRFQEVLSEHPILQLKVVATEALRRAKNADVFIRAAQKVGFEIDIISGEQEAKLIFRGICDPLVDSLTRRLTIDIGGASTEIAIGNSETIFLAESIPMGCVRWRDQYFPKKLDYAKRSIAAKEAAYLQIKPILPALRKGQWEEVYASSGSAKMIANIAIANEWSDGAITNKVIRNTEKAISQVARAEEINIPGLNPQRLDLLAPGISILATIMESLNIESIIYSPTSLREGILGELSQQRVDYRLYYNVN